MYAKKKKPNDETLYGTHTKTITHFDKNLNYSEVHIKSNLNPDQSISSSSNRNNRYLPKNRNSKSDNNNRKFKHQHGRKYIYQNIDKTANKKIDVSKIKVPELSDEWQLEIRNYTQVISCNQKRNKKQSKMSSYKNPPITKPLPYQSSECESNVASYINASFDTEELLQEELVLPNSLQSFSNIETPRMIKSESQSPNNLQGYKNSSNYNNPNALKNRILYEHSSDTNINFSSNFPENEEELIRVTSDENKVEVKDNNNNIDDNNNFETSYCNFTEEAYSYDSTPVNTLESPQQIYSTKTGNLPIYENYNPSNNPDLILIDASTGNPINLSKASSFLNNSSSNHEIELGGDNNRSRKNSSLKEVLRRNWGLERESFKGSSVTVDSSSVVGYHQKSTMEVNESIIMTNHKVQTKQNVESNPTTPQPIAKIRSSPQHARSYNLRSASFNQSDIPYYSKYHSLPGSNISYQTNSTSKISSFPDNQSLSSLKQLVRNGNQNGKQDYQNIYSGVTYTGFNIRKKDNRLVKSFGPSRHKEMGKLKLELGVQHLPDYELFVKETGHPSNFSSSQEVVKSEPSASKSKIKGKLDFLQNSRDMFLQRIQTDDPFFEESNCCSTVWPFNAIKNYFSKTKLGLWLFAKPQTTFSKPEKLVFKNHSNLEVVSWSVVNPMVDSEEKEECSFITIRDTEADNATENIPEMIDAGVLLQEQNLAESSIKPQKIPGYYHFWLSHNSIFKNRRLFNNFHFTPWYHWTSQENPITEDRVTDQRERYWLGQYTRPIRPIRNFENKRIGGFRYSPNQLTERQDKATKLYKSGEMRYFLKINWEYNLEVLVYMGEQESDNENPTMANPKYIIRSIAPFSSIINSFNTYHDSSYDSSSSKYYFGILDAKRVSKHSSANAHKSVVGSFILSQNEVPIGVRFPKNTSLNERFVLMMTILCMERDFRRKW